MKLQKLKNIVLACLQGEPITRTSDRILYAKVCADMGYDTHNMTAWDMLHDKDMPSFESVGRARRKAQEEHPELRACPAVERMRDELEGEFRTFALEGV